MFGHPGLDDETLIWQSEKTPHDDDDGDEDFWKARFSTFDANPKIYYWTIVTDAVI